MSTINTSSLSDHLPPALTADHLHSMKTSEPKAQQVFFKWVQFNLSILLATAVFWASQKVEKLEKEEQVVAAGDFPSSSATKRCVVIIEGEPHPGATRGRMSFLSFNPSIDKLNEEACDLSQNGSTATSSGRQTETTSTRENTSLQDDSESDNLINDGELKRKHPDLSSESSYPNKSRKNSVQHQDSSPSSSRSSQKQQKREKLDWNILQPPKHQCKER
ncbi:hypothetical protein F511_13778 [Dorcoceras hygrometricum]|uniref:Uncharacterized protein n=1 Tax=Dorcoceras hygrometricum TaxID=472368 RepID=A0A2Z7B9Q5_9LAMI|nr:hypothetical protein F511_13778 [Dorcoceras hygrometricum]